MPEQVTEFVPQNTLYVGPWKLRVAGGKLIADSIDGAVPYFRREGMAIYLASKNDIGSLTVDKDR